ncbi:MAG: phage portal protein [Hyphomicrobiales bacterium]|nr:MAG: phage portal protein [Hyphomicrobiales bacterium]
MAVAPHWAARIFARAKSSPKTTEASEVKASRTAALIAVQGHTQPRWTPRDYTALTREGVLKNPVVYRCIRMISEAAASLTLLAYEDDRELDTHPLLAILKQPGSPAGGPDLLEMVFGHLLTSGNAYLEGVVLGDELRELYALRPDRMKVVPGSSGWPEAWEYTANGKKLRFDQSSADLPPILHLSLFHPLDDHYGLAPLEPAQMALDLHNQISASAKALLDNSARPSGALVYHGDDAGRMSQEQFDRLKAELENTYQGGANAGRPLLLEGGLDWKPMGLSPREMDFAEARAGAARDIALAFGVPPMLLGIPGDNTFANYAEANRALWRQTVLPMVARTLRAMSHWLTPLYGQKFHLDYDADKIDALASEREAVWRRLEGASFLTTAEKREALGYSPNMGAQ